MTSRKERGKQCRSSTVNGSSRNILGNKNVRLLAVHESRPERHAELSELLRSPTVYDAFLRLLARQGHAVPQTILERDISRAWVERAELVPVLQAIYADTASTGPRTPLAKTSST
jgi:tryptophan 2,3-dioxygenase